MSFFPSADQYASAFSPPNVSWRTFARCFSPSYVRDEPEQGRRKSNGGSEVPLCGGDEGASGPPGKLQRILHDPQDSRPVLLEAGRADSADLEQFHAVARFLRRDVEQREIAQNPEGRHLLAASLLEPPAAERLDECGRDRLGERRGLRALCEFRQRLLPALSLADGKRSHGDARLDHRVGRAPRPCEVRAAEADRLAVLLELVVVDPDQASARPPAPRRPRPVARPSRLRSSSSARLSAASSIALGARSVVATPLEGAHESQRPHRAPESSWSPKCLTSWSIRHAEPSAKRRIRSSWVLRCSHCSSYGLFQPSIPRDASPSGVTMAPPKLQSFSSAFSNSSGTRDTALRRSSDAIGSGFSARNTFSST